MALATTLRAQPAPASRSLAYAGLAFAVLCWGGAFIAAKVLLREMDALPAAAWRFVVAAALLWPFTARSMRGAGLRSIALPLAVMVVCGGLLYPSLFMWSLERTTATNTSLVVATMPVLTFLLCPWIGEAVPRRRWVAVIVALCGAAVLITRGDANALYALTHLNTGDLLALVAASVWAIFNLASRGVVMAVSPAVVNTVLFSVGGVGLLALSSPLAAVGQLQSLSAAGWAALGFLAVGPSMVSGYFYLHGVRTLGISRAVVFIYCVPFVTATLAALVLGEPLNRYQAVGGALIFAGLLMALDRRAEFDREA